MTNEMVSADGVFVVYGTDPDNSSTAQLSDNGDGTYSGVMSGLTTGDTLGYFFVNGIDILNDLEMVPAECGVMDPNLGINVRPLVVEGFEDYSLEAVCFSTCSSFCPSLDCNETPVVSENIDNYTAGEPVAIQSDVWATWDGGEEGGALDAPVSTEQAASEPNSIHLVGGASVDILANLGNQTEGKWDLRFKIYVPAGMAAYYNIQDNENSTPNQWNLEVSFNADGTLGEDVTGSYTQDAWVDVVMIIDLDNDFAELIIEGESVYTWVYEAAWKIGSLNFFPRDASDEYFIDDLIMRPIDSCPIGAIICDDFEYYSPTATVSAQSAFWAPWDAPNGDPFDVFVTEEVAASESCQSMPITDADPDDVVLLLGDRNTGRYNLEWNMYIDAGATAYFNLQHEEALFCWAYHVIFEEGTASLIPGSFNNAPAATFDYTDETWFNVRQTIDADNDWAELYIDDTFIAGWRFSVADNCDEQVTLGAVNFFGNTGNSYYIDDVLFQQLASIPGNVCAAANDISGLFGAEQGEPQTSGQYDNTEYSTTQFDPAEGYECFLELPGPSLENTIWYTFVGDGETYKITTVECGATNYLDDTQIAVYTGDCTALMPVPDGCAEDISTTEFVAELELVTEPGVMYYMLIDGWNGGNGEFCVEVTKLTQAVATVTFTVDMNLQDFTPGEVYLSGSFNGFPNQGETMDDSDGDGVYTLDVAVNVNTTYQYKFQNGAGGWESILDDWGGPCTVGDFGDREVVVGTENVVLDEVCFNFCVDCEAVTDVSDNTLEQGITVFPNPATELLTVNFDLAEATERLNIRLINVLGQVVYNDFLGSIQADFTTIDVSNLPAGTYMIHAQDGEAQFTQTVVIE